MSSVRVYFKCRPAIAMSTMSMCQPSTVNGSMPLCCSSPNTACNNNVFCEPACLRSLSSELGTRTCPNHCGLRSSERRGGGGRKRGETPKQRGPRRKLFSGSRTPQVLCNLVKWPWIQCPREWAHRTLHRIFDRLVPGTGIRTKDTCGKSRNYNVRICTLDKPSCCSSGI